MTRSSDPIVDESPNAGVRGEESPSERLSRAVEDRVPGVKPGHDPGTWTSVFRGAEGGLVATIVMTIFRMPVFRALPPTSEFWGQYVGGGPAEEYTAPGLVLHLLYGTVGGTVLGVLFPHIDRRSPARTQATALLSGVVYGFVLSAFGVRVIFRHLLNRELDEEDVLVFHVAHVVYGLTLGMWLGKRQSRGEAYESRKAGDETAPAR
jgi:uncharacterized membrane protein YeaQ/YmgE (transglycosylase-associated protein family)